MLQIGFISAWHVHTKDYAAQLQAMGDTVKITVIWDEDAERGKAWAQQYGCDFESNYDTFLQRQDVEAVVCDSPTTMHLELLAKAAQAGKHIFTEKLLATNTEDCRQLCEIIEKSGVVFTISLPLRSAAHMLYAKQLVEEGTLGRISGARMRRSHSGVSDDWLPAHWFDVSKSGGGAMMDLGAHPVYMLSFLFGAPKRVSGMTSNLFGTSSDENAIALVEFENGVLGTCETAFVTFGVPDILEVYGTKGSLFIWGDQIKVVTKDLADKGLGYAVPRELPQPLPAPIQQFVAACTGGDAPQCLGTSDALIMTKIIESTYVSDQENKTVVL